MAPSSTRRCSPWSSTCRNRRAVNPRRRPRGSAVGRALGDLGEEVLPGRDGCADAGAHERDEGEDGGTDEHPAGDLDGVRHRKEDEEQTEVRRDKACGGPAVEPREAGPTTDGPPPRTDGTR